MSALALAELSPKHLRIDARTRELARDRAAIERALTYIDCNPRSLAWIARALARGDTAHAGELLHIEVMHRLNDIAIDQINDEEDEGL